MLFLKLPRPEEAPGQVGPFALYNWPLFVWLPGGCGLPGPSMMGFQDGNIISEPTEEPQRVRGRERMLRVASTVLPSAKGSSLCSFSPPSGVTQLPREARGFQCQGRWEGVRTCSTCVLDTFRPVPRRARILGDTPGTRQERQAWRRGQLSAGGWGCWGRGSRAPRRALRTSLWPAGLRGEGGVRSWLWRRSCDGCAGCRPPTASVRVGPTRGAADPTIPG